MLKRFVTPNILQSQFTAKDLKKPENCDCSVVLLLFLFTLEALILKDSSTGSI